MQTSDQIKHVAIIMDGNGRWAQERRRPRMWGHVRGAQVANTIIEEAVRLNLASLTLYAFSTENFSRPELEILTIFNLLEKFIEREKNKVVKNDVRFRLIGDRSKLPQKLISKVEALEDLSKSNKGMFLNLAFSYGGRLEIVTAVNKLIASGKTKICEQDISDSLYNPEVSNIDLLIRTGGDERVSNFLLWQIAYAELVFTSTKWPDFASKEFCDILTLSKSRDRRFGNIKVSK